MTVTFPAAFPVHLAPTHRAAGGGVSRSHAPGPTRPARPPLPHRFHADRIDDRAGDRRGDCGVRDSRLSGLSGAQPRRRRGLRWRRRRGSPWPRTPRAAMRSAAATRRRRARVMSSRSRSTKTSGQITVAFTTRVAAAGTNTLVLVPSVPDNVDTPTARCRVDAGCGAARLDDVGNVSPGGKAASSLPAPGMGPLPADAPTFAVESRAAGMPA